RRRHTRFSRDWSSDVCSSDLHAAYRVLAVSVNRVAHFEGGPEGLREAPLSGVPTSLSDALGDELTEVQFRVRGPGPAGSMHGSEIGRASGREGVEMAEGEVT